MNDILLEQLNIPSVEEIYDMELEVLIDNKDSLNALINSNSMIINNQDLKDEISEILGFINFEIKDRNSILELNNYFKNVSAESFLSDIEKRILSDKKVFTKDYEEYNLSSQSTKEQSIIKKIDKQIEEGEKNTLPLIEIKRMLKNKNFTDDFLLKTKTDSKGFFLDRKENNSNLKAKQNESYFNKIVTNKKAVVNKNEYIAKPNQVNSLNLKLKLKVKYNNNNNMLPIANNKNTKECIIIDKPKSVVKKIKTNIIRKISAQPKETNSLDIRKNYIVPLPVDIVNKIVKKPGTAENKINNNITMNTNSIKGYDTFYSNNTLKVVDNGYVFNTITSQIRDESDSKLNILKEIPAIPNTIINNEKDEEKKPFSINKFETNIVEEIIINATPEEIVKNDIPIRKSSPQICEDIFEDPEITKMNNGLEVKEIYSNTQQNKEAQFTFRLDKYNINNDQTTKPIINFSSLPKSNDELSSPLLSKHKSRNNSILSISNINSNSMSKSPSFIDKLDNSNLFKKQFKSINYNKDKSILPIRSSVSIPSKINFNATSSSLFKRNITKSSLSKQKQMPVIIPNLPDYTRIFPTFQHLFNGYYTNSENKVFDYIGTMKELYTSFSSLIKFEETNCNSKIEVMSASIINSEADLIKNRLKKLSEKLLFDQRDLTEEGFYMYKKILELQKKNYHKQADSKSIEKFFFRVVLSRPEVYDIVSYCLGVKPEWRELPHGMLLGNTWNILWTYSYPKINLSKILSIQKVNHLHNNRVISRKDALKKSIDRVKKLNNRAFTEFDIIPETYILGKEYIDFLDSYSKYGGRLNKQNIWIVKPNGNSRGRGIFLTNELSDVQPTDGYLVQRYISNPLLLNNFYKFDLRIYALVTSVNPLEAFIYSDGFARVSNYEYSNDNLDRMIHLTNAAVQNKESKKNENLEKQYGGSKISLEMLKKKLNRERIDWDKIWEQIRLIVLKTLIACQYEISYNPSCFELFGFDIMIDDNFKCWLIEVNMSPSLERTNVLDDQIKLQLVDDILKVLQIPNINREGLCEVLDRRIQQESRSNMAQTSSNYLYSPSIQLNIDMNKIFEGKFPRQFGEDPRDFGKFERLAPSSKADYLIKIANKSEKDKYGVKKNYLSNNDKLI